MADSQSMTTQRSQRPPAGSFDQSLTKLSDQARRDEALQRRLQRADRADAAKLSGDFHGTLVELHERRVRGVIALASGARISGEISEVGSDVIVVSTPSTDAFIGRRHVVWVQSQAEVAQRDSDVDRTAPTFGDLIDRRFSRGDRIATAITSQDAINGSLLAVGVDQLSMRRDGDGDTVTVPFTAIEQVVAL